MINDPFDTASDSLIGPARLAFPITPSDSTDLSVATKAVYVGMGGDVVLRAIGSATDVTLSNVASGSVLAIRVKAVRAAGTTANNLVGLA